METLVVIVIGIVVITIVTAIGQRVNIAAPLVLVAVGLLTALTPFIPNLRPVDPEIILIGVLPPLLYSSAINLPAIEFRRDFRPIAGLSVFLVIISSVVLGLFFSWAIPGLPLAVGVALGAILSPTDAVATSIVKRVGLSPRVVTMLEGESLLNDATALVLLRTATIAIAGSFSMGLAIGTFLWGVLVAIVIGGVIGWLTLRLRAWIGNAAANTALSFAIPFIAYLPTEALGGSGLVSAVVAGVVIGQGAARWLTPEQRISDALNWRTIELILEGGVFLLMGLELTDVVTKNLTEHDGLWHGTWLALAALAALAIIVLVRAVYVTLLLWGQGRRARRYARFDLDRIGTRLDALESGEPVTWERDGARTRTSRRRTRALPRDPEARARRIGDIRRRVTRLAADLDYYRSSPLGWKHGTVIVWAGMRGVVTLAAAQTLPIDTTHRPLLVYIAFAVAVVSLLLQGFTLPPLVRALRIRRAPEANEGSDDEALQDELREAGAAVLRNDRLARRDGTPFSPDMLQRVGARLAEPPDPDMTGELRERLELRLVMIEAMRRRLVEVTSTGRYSSALLRRTLAELDADQLSLELKIAGNTDD
ncbi:sodium:proton antiporter [Microbacterium sp. SORGH_AS_0888]|uniref:cation:proton antiporter n=1 Tax=Microbacterium sp. SORGH_AS_0888 TaxID=3041791 RepID=UPI002784E7A7|nr:sodium:proton antiporter [Microbacterium sp. SORGH_AS_0888]MDQ1130169.1 NhaP-type Na+/H+ or K+/H+ antiporter [Microbacterium sp. SORGH_AS_0888]